MTTQPTSYGGRPVMPAPGAPTPERLVARFRGHARRLAWSALVLIAVAGATAYFAGNLPAPFEDWMLLTAAGIVVFVFVLLPYFVWLSHVYTITTKRVIERSGLIAVRRRELSHVRGYTIRVKRGILQRIWGCGTLVLSNGVDPPITVANVPRVQLVHEALVDQVEVSQILAHRDAQAIPPMPPAPAPR